MNTTFYFPHDFNAGQDYKIIALISKHSASGYGVYWRIIEMLHSDDSHTLPHNDMIWSVISMTMNVPTKDVQNIIETCIEYKLLYLNENGAMYSNRVNYNIGYRETIRQNKIEGGKKSAEKRKKIELDSTSTEVQQQFNSSSTDVQQYPNKGKERKGKEKKENKDILSFSPEFEQVWATYGKVGSKKDAYKIWDKMDEVKRNMVVASIPGYKKHLTKTGYAPKHFTTYLNSDEYENYLNISTSTGGEIKQEEIVIYPCAANNFDFSLIKKFVGKTKEEFYQVIKENREECKKLYQCMVDFDDEDMREFRKLHHRHPYNVFIDIYYEYCHDNN